MTLTNPLWLLAAASVIVPILIHLFGRPRPRLHRFPSLMLLRRVQRERHSTTRLRRIASLLLRCLALILLALMLAGPLTGRSALARLGEPVGITAIVLDTSPSMDARLETGRPMDRARAAALAVLDTLPDGEHVIVGLSHSDTASVLPVADARRLIAGASLTDRRARLADSLAGLLDSDRAPGRIFLATDLQASSLGALPPVQGTPARAIVIDTGAEVGGNSSPLSVEAHSPVLLRGRPLELTVRARTWGEGPGRVPVTVDCADESVTAGIDLLPDAPAAASLELPPPEAGLLACSARIPADAMPADDEALFATHVRGRLRVALVGSDRQTRFLAAALDPWPQGDPRSVIDVVRAGDLSPDQALDAVIFAGDATADGLEALTSRGTGALLFAGAGREVLDAAGLEQVTLQSPVRRVDGAALAEMATGRDPLAGFADPGSGDLTAARFSTLPGLGIEDDAGLTILARYDDGTPALIEGAAGRARTLLFATSPDDAWGDLVRMPEFVPLMHRLVTYLAAGTQPTILPGAPGEPTVAIMPSVGQASSLSAVQSSVGQAFDPVTLSAVAVPPFVGQASSLSAVPSSVGQAFQPVTPSVVTSDGHWHFIPPTRGAYRLIAGEEEFAAVAVNLDPAESDPTRLSPADVRERLKPLAAQVVEADALERFLARLQPESADLSSLFALLALLVLAVEAVQSLGVVREPRGGS